MYLAAIVLIAVLRKAVTFLMRAILYLFAIAVGAALLWWAISSWEDRNLLKGYGVFYNKSFGEHESLQELQFYWDRNGKRIEGPIVTGDDLYVRFISVAGEGVPEIIVQSDDDESAVVVFKLNFTDANKPDFELIEDQELGVWYLPPWGDYYHRDKESPELQPRDE